VPESARQSLGHNPSTFMRDGSSAATTANAVNLTGVRPTLGVLLLFLAVTAGAGGFGLLTGSIVPGLDRLAGSPFRSYAIPGLVLVLIVSGSALRATMLLIMRRADGPRAAIIAGMMVVSFDVVEVLVIGSPAGLARNLQVFYFALGFAVVWLGHMLRQPAVSDRA
jgi:hypothetical protein